MIEFSSSFKLNEIHKVDSPFNEDPKNIIFFHGGPNFRGRNVGKFREIGQNRDIYCYANRRVVNFEREYQPRPPGTKILVMPQFSYMPNVDLSLGSFPPKIQGRIQNFFIGANVFSYKLVIAKMSLKNFHSLWSYLEKNMRDVKMTPALQSFNPSLGTPWFFLYNSQSF